MFDVFWGNMMTLSVVWAFVQFHRHDYRAPWLAYIALLLPAALASLNVLATEPLPPHLDALSFLQSDAPDP